MKRREPEAMDQRDAVSGADDLRRAQADLGDLVRNVTSTMLRGLGFSVLGATDGFEAVAEFGKHPAEIHLVLCDLGATAIPG